jgi:hypothetical protein
MNRTRRVPDEVVDRGLSRPLSEDTTGSTNWQDARNAGQRGDLIRMKSVVQVHLSPPPQTPTLGQGHPACPHSHLRIQSAGLASPLNTATSIVIVRVW